MPSYQLPAISKIPSLESGELAATLDHLFEPSVPLHTLSVPLLRDRTFTSYDDLVHAVGSQLTDLSNSTSTSDTRWLESILSAHPRLGEKKITSGQSSAEQAQLHGDPAEAEKLAKLNADYEKSFPGLRYVVFVNGRDRETVMDDMLARIRRGNLQMERTDAIQAMCDIASDRAGKTPVAD